MNDSGDKAKQLARASRSLFGARSRVGAFLREIGSTRVSEAFYGLRWLSAAIVVLFLIQLFTGILLSLYYYAEPGVAYDSIRFLNSEIATGWLIRSTHNWAADLLLLAVLAHLFLIFYRRAYREPREYLWCVGVIMLPAFLAFRFTGRLLPWDTLGYEATRRGLQLLESVPVIGSWAAHWLRGGEDMGANTLSRFFTTHTLILPWLVLLLASFHFYLVGRHGLRRDR